MHEVRVTRAVRRLDLDIPFAGCLRVGDLRQRHGDAGREQHSELPAGNQAPGLILRHTFCKMIFIAHVGSSSSRSIRWYVEPVHTPEAAFHSNLIGRSRFGEDSAAGPRSHCGHENHCDEPREGIHSYRLRPGHRGHGNLRGRRGRRAGRRGHRHAADGGRSRAWCEGRAQPAPDMGCPHRAYRRRRRCRVRGISDPCGRCDRASLPAVAGGAIGRRLGAVAAICGGRRARAGARARSRIGAKPARGVRAVGIGCPP